jgi:biopolymer transport protein ExbD
MARRKAGEGLEAEELGLQLTPMIDVIFQLLIFFMVNIKFRTLEGLLKAFLPPASAVPTSDPEKKKKIVIDVQELTGGGVLISLNKEPLGGADDKERYDVLYQRLRGVRETFAGEKMPPVIINAGMEVQYRYVVKALNACGKAKIEDVMFATP